MNTIRTQVHGEPRSKASRVSWQLFRTYALALILAPFTLPAGAQLWHPTAITSAQGEPTYTAPQLYQHQPPTALTSGLDKIKHGLAGTDATELTLSDMGTRGVLPECKTELMKKYFARHFARLQVRKEVVLP